MTDSSLDSLSQRTMAGKEERARAGYHSGPVPFGYLPPDYPKASAGAPSTWRPPRLPVRPDPVTFPALVHIGELVAQGWTDAAIAEELAESLSHSSRLGAPRLTKDSIAAIRRSWFPCEFAPGCGHGTIQTPSGEVVEGKHQAAWPYELWQRMVEVKANQYRRPRKEAQRQPHEFSRIIVCAACRCPLRVTTSDTIPYYSDSSRTRHLECPASGSLTVRSERVIQQFAEVLRNIVLPHSWRQAIAERCQEETQEGNDAERMRHRRAELEAEQQRVVTVFTKGVITEEELDAAMEDIRAELATLPLSGTRSGDEMTQAALSAGETLGNLADYWSEATAEERRDLVWSLLTIGGLVYDLERQGIVGLLPRESVLPVLSLGLEATGQWEQCGGGLWLRQQYWSEKRTRSTPHVLPLQASSLTPAQQEEAVALLQQGWSLREVAHQLGASRGSIHRLARKAGVMLPENGPKLTPTQQEEALEMVRSGASLRQVAQRFGINHESVRRLVRKQQREQEA
jgi:transposase